MRDLTKYEANLIAKLLEDRAAICLRNAIECRELDTRAATVVAPYWSEQRVIASDLAVLYREAGK